MVHNATTAPSPLSAISGTISSTIAQAARKASKSAISGTTTSGTTFKKDWRIEVTGKGRYFNYRKGRGAERKGSYGGKFEKLSRERQNEYHQNVHTHAR